MATVDHRQPPDVEPVGTNAARAGADFGAPLRRIDGASITSRELSTTQSEYSNAVPNGRFSALPTGWWVTSIVAEAGRWLREASRSYSNSHERNSHDGRSSEWAGIAKRIGRTRCGAILSQTSRSASAARMRRNALRSSPARSPWISRGEA